MVEDSVYFKIINNHFPIIANKIKVFWGYPEFTKLMFDLQQVNDDRLRTGFPDEVLTALFELETDHDLIWPHFARNDKNIWTIDGH